LQPVWILTHVFCTCLQPTAEPWDAHDVYPTIWGLTELKGITFSDFGVSPCDTGSDAGARNFAIAGHSPTARAADAWHPMSVREMEVVRVDADSVVRFPGPDSGWLNQDDCIDMDCDGPRVSSRDLSLDLPSQLSMRIFEFSEFILMYLMI
jgi:hypothetical protein